VFKVESAAAAMILELDPASKQCSRAGENVMRSAAGFGQRSRWQGRNQVPFREAQGDEGVIGSEMQILLAQTPHDLASRAFRERRLQCSQVPENNPRACLNEIRCAMGKRPAEKVHLRAAEESRDK
jgi:hypothetical protein